MITTVSPSSLDGLKLFLLLLERLVSTQQAYNCSSELLLIEVFQMYILQLALEYMSLHISQ